MSAGSSIALLAALLFVVAVAATAGEAITEQLASGVEGVDGEFADAAQGLAGVGAVAQGGEAALAEGAEAFFTAATAGATSTPSA